MKIDEILDNLADMVLAIKSDKQLELTILSFGEKSEIERKWLITIMSERMLAEKKDEQLVKTFRLLVDKKIFDLTIQALSLD